MIVLLCWAALLLKIPDDQNCFALFLFCKEDVGWVLCTGVYWDVYTSLLGQAAAKCWCFTCIQAVSARRIQARAVDISSPMAAQMCRQSLMMLTRCLAQIGMITLPSEPFSHIHSLRAPQNCTQGNNCCQFLDCNSLYFYPA